MPETATGKTGQLASQANLKAPSLKGSISPSRERVPSGKMSTGTPRSRWARQRAIMVRTDSRSPRQMGT